MYTGQFSVVVLVPGTTSLVVRFSASLSGSAVPGGASGLNFEVFRNPSHAGGVHFMRTKAAGLPVTLECSIHRLLVVVLVLVP